MTGPIDLEIILKRLYIYIYIYIYIYKVFRPRMAPCIGIKWRALNTETSRAKINKQIHKFFAVATRSFTRLGDHQAAGETFGNKNFFLFYACRSFILVLIKYIYIYIYIYYDYIYIIYI